MDWLKDVIAKKELQERNTEEKRRLERGRLSAELGRVAPMVKRLLCDLGRMQYGSHWLSPLKEKFVIVEDRCACDWRWCLRQDYALVYFEVSLFLDPTPYFRVLSGAGYHQTKDTSEEELKRVLRIAAEHGPHREPR